MGRGTATGTVVADHERPGDGAICRGHDTGLEHGEPTMARLGRVGLNKLVGEGVVSR